MISSRISLLRTAPGQACRLFSSTSLNAANESHRIVVAGGGAGGLSVASTLSKWFPGQVAVVEPSENHYYQPMWTLVGAGLKTLEDSRRPEADLMPKDAVWIKEKCAEFQPETNTLITDSGKEIEYEYLVVALGLKVDFTKVEGLQDAIGREGVGSNYSADTVNDTHRAIQEFKRGVALFTHPAGPMKCAGAPQKIMYLAEDQWRQNGVRDKADIMLKMGTPFLFAVPKYREALMEVCARRNMKFDCHRNLTKIDADKKEATFAILNEEGKTETINYDMIHVVPPMTPVDALAGSSLVDATGFVEVNKQTLQHTRFPNVFSLGDCSNIPTSKTAAAAAAQSKVLKKNLKSLIDGGKAGGVQYNGYTTCPLVTSDKSAIIAEFDYDLNPVETFPVDQGKERRSMYFLKSTILPEVYWRMMLKGNWAGPAGVRSALHLGMK